MTGRVTSNRVRDLLAKMERDIRLVKAEEWEPTGHIDEVDGQKAIYMQRIPAWRRVQKVREDIERIVSWYAAEIEQALDE